MSRRRGDEPRVGDSEPETPDATEHDFCTVPLTAPLVGETSGVGVNAGAVATFGEQRAWPGGAGGAVRWSGGAHLGVGTLRAPRPRVSVDGGPPVATQSGEHAQK